MYILRLTKIQYTIVWFNLLCYQVTRFKQPINLVILNILLFYRA